MHEAMLRVLGDGQPVDDRQDQLRTHRRRRHAPVLVAPREQAGMPPAQLRDELRVPRHGLRLHARLAFDAVVEGHARVTFERSSWTCRRGDTVDDVALVCFEQIKRSLTSGVAIAADTRVYDRRHPQRGLTRAARSHSERIAVIQAVANAAAHEPETDWIEWKLSLDVSTTEGSFKVARGILGFGNRDPGYAARFAAGCAYVRS